MLLIFENCCIISIRYPETEFLLKHEDNPKTHRRFPSNTYVTVGQNNGNIEHIFSFFFRGHGFYIILFAIHPIDFQHQSFAVVIEILTVNQSLYKLNG